MIEQPRWLRHSVSEWNAGTLDRDLLRLDAKTMRRHPGFQRAKQQFALNMLEAFETHKPLNRLLRGERELAFLAFVLALHQDYDANDPGSGATYSRVLDLFAILDVGSPTLVKAMLALTRLRGLLKVEPAAGRQKRLIPTDALLDTLLVWLRANLNAIAMIAPLPEPADVVGARPAMLYKIYRYGVDAYRFNRFILSEDFPAVRACMTRNHGYLVLMAIVASLERRADGRCLASVPSAALANRLSVARGTVRNVLNLAQRHGWLRKMSRGSHTLELCPDFAELCEDWMSMELAWMSGAARTAYIQLAKAQD